jgi:hypothetical protein|tara:strand:+ start:79 stop:252 length:174 start_codon:yes stop_codon:yes gene_type:complete
MRQNYRSDPRHAKKIARIKYAERQIEKYIKWTIENRGKLIYNELEELHNKYNINCYG